MMPAITWTHRNVRSSSSTMRDTRGLYRHGAGGAAGAPTILQDLHERSTPQLVERHARHGDRLVLGHCAAVDRAEEEGQQPLTGRRVVEYVADESRLCGPLDEVAEPRALLLEAGEEKGVHRCITRDELCRVQIPALIETGLQRVADVLVVHPP